MLLKSVRARLFISILGILVVFYCAPKLAASILMALLSYASFRSAVRQAHKAHWVSKWDIVRFLRGIRKSFGASPAALTLYAMCFCLSAIALSIIVSTQASWAFSLFGIAGGILCVATYIDWHIRLKFVLSITAIRNVAKLGVAFLAATTVFISTVIAKQLTHSIALADPASMPEFVHLVSTFIFPFALSAVLSATLSFLMTAQYAVLLVGVFVTMPIKYTAAFFSPPTRNQLTSIGYRVLHGKRPSNNRAWWEPFVDGVQHFLRPIGTGAIASIVFFLGAAIIQFADQIPRKYVQTLLITVEYHNPHLCENIPAALHIAYLQDGYASVATPQQDGYKFFVEKCHK